MKKHNLRKIFGFGAITVLALALAACGPKESESSSSQSAAPTTTNTQSVAVPEVPAQTRADKVNISGPIFGTTYSMIYFGDEVNGMSKEDIQKGVETTLQTINIEMSTYIPDSTISLFNKFTEINTKFEVPESLYSLVVIADKIHKQSDNKYDITILPLVNAWGFGPKTITKLPTDDEITAAQARVGHDKLKYYTEDGKFYLEKTIPDLTIDLSSIAKGFAVDKVIEYLESVGAKNALVEIGGEVRVIGKNDSNTNWNVAVESPDIHPSSQKLIDSVISLTNNSVATSGDYRNFTYKDGKRISHTIDPTTGHPITHLLASVSVIDPSNAVADAYATALNVSGPEKAMQIAKDNNLPVLLIIYNGEGFIHKASPAFLELNKGQ